MLWVAENTPPMLYVLFLVWLLWRAKKACEDYER